MRSVKVILSEWMEFQRFYVKEEKEGLETCNGNRGGVSEK